jgi:hypothetical protein
MCPLLMPTKRPDLASVGAMAAFALAPLTCNERDGTNQIRRGERFVVLEWDLGWEAALDEETLNGCEQAKPYAAG